MNYVVRRLIGSVFQVLAVSFLAGVLFHLAPGDYFTDLKTDPRVTTETVAAWKKQAQDSTGLPSAYWSWVSSFVKGEWGTSLAYGIPVRTLVGQRVAKSAGLVIPAWFGGWALGLLVAALASPRRNLCRVALDPAAMGVNYIPEAIAATLVLWLVVWWGGTLGSYLWPLVTLLVPTAALVYLHAVTAFRTASEAMFVRLAASRGLARPVLTWRYIAPAAAPTLISLIGPSLVGAVGSALVVEAVMGWPGLGPLFVEAAQSRDYPIVQAVLVWLAAVLTVTNLLTDLWLFRSDPRLGAVA